MQSEFRKGPVDMHQNTIYFIFGVRADVRMRGLF